ncbi:MAG: tRNA (adenosine(37)-N6)-threonylcarbamoyltransferase complex dimerization subunit type 1 TsaB [bacterium]|nr:tRNA (adenosine(37)-N6)-threonylcarbamoyltransferase complex dimerization subunit type 1 TsaB [bacterium]
MIILGIETSTSAGSVAITSEEKVLAEYTQNNSCSHSVWLISAINTILIDAEIKVKAIEGISISCGPGAFTSLRVGISTAKGLAQNLNIPLAPVSSLEVLASNISFNQINICPIIDAKRKEIYAAFFKYQDYKLKQFSENLIISPLSLIEKIKEPTIFLGNGTVLYKEILREKLGELAIFLPEIYNLPRGALVATLGEQKIKEGRVPNLFEIEPLYLRKPM